MIVHKKMRDLRKSKHWTQEDMAEKLEMSTNGYGDIERGKTDVTLSPTETNC